MGVLNADPPPRWQQRLNAWVFVVLVLIAAGLLAHLSVRYTMSFDVTGAARHSLSATSVSVLSRLAERVVVTAYMHNNPDRRRLLRDLLARYQRHKADVELHFVDPDAVPDEIRQLGISQDGELIVRYGERTEHVLQHSEKALTNALQRVARASDQWLMFLEGHGERQALGEANHDLRDWSRQLENRGFRIQPLNLAATGTVPDNASVLIIASPQVSLLPAEVGVIYDYLESGGNLLWLAEPDAQQGLEPITALLGMRLDAGTVVDPTTQQLGIDHPTVTLITSYQTHPATDGFRFLTLFPQASAISIDGDSVFAMQPLLQSNARAWLETGPLEGAVGLDEGDRQGPVTIGASFTRSLNGNLETQQRVVVIGDGDFLSNAFLGNSGNQDLGLRVVTWLAADDDFIDIPARLTPDADLQLARPYAIAMAFGFLLVLPLALAGCGTYIWWLRRNS